ncbi:hypothetical protein EYD45_04065 [Hyunsoonleella flava]|uniref:Zinc-dependent peptidase n=1 Tax=Hyunsoonleella flava TaxID=2527939 RepID=A0A4Q9FGT5_9FLAO|nr:zinc-dependent peptidase [Hyunsoonleella flava]TBN05460.1 hypothetical protein EYD45_04065 [Hyunsoonleella flava]
MLLLEQTNYDFIGNIILAILLMGVLFLILLFIRKIITSVLDGLEMVYALFTKRPFFVHFHPFKRKLSKEQTRILEKEFAFYRRLDKKRKSYFKHRVATFIKKKTFEGKEGFIITDKVKILVSATAAMLTFGFRNYKIPYVKNVVVYPTEYFSRFSKTTNKGEFNARLKTLVLSWDNFLEGHRIEDDKLNLGIHEFAHAIHFSCIKSEDINSILFVDTFNELRNMLSDNETLKTKLTNSEFIRSYAFTNDSELLAVIIETFIESPKVFKSLFPNIYIKVKQMLNFNFADY